MAEAEGTGPSITAYLGVLQKRRVALIIALLAIVVPAVPLILAAPSIYEARARLLIEPEASTPLPFNDEGASRAADRPSFETQYELLRNAALARQTIEQLKLWESPAFLASDQAVDPIGAVRWAFRAVSDLFGAGRAAGAAGTQAKDRAAGLVDTFLARLSIRPIDNSRLVDVVFASRDPALAAKVANTLSRLNVEQDLESRFKAAQDAADWLGKRLDEQRAAVDASEAAVQKYREANRSVSLDDRQNITIQRMAELNSAVTAARTTRIQKESLYNQLVALQNDRAALDTFPLILSNPFIQQLKSQIADLQREVTQLSAKYGDLHPEMIRVRGALQAAEARLQAEIAKIVDSVRNDFTAAQAQEQNLVGLLEGQKRQALTMNRVAIDYAALQRNAATDRQVLDTLMQQAKETGLATALKTTNIRIVEEAAVPAMPVRPQRARNLLLVLFGSAFFAAGLVFALEYFDSRLKSPEELRAHLGVPFLGLVPAVPHKVLDGSTPLIGRHASSDFGEAFRRVRTAILLSTSAEEVRTLAVTSTGPREGKTVVASNLAVVLAQGGRHVLLIDADMRRPQVHALFDKPQQPGLSTVLAVKTPLKPLIQQSDIQGLEVLAAGTTPPNPAELLGLPRFSQLLQQFASSYDHVIIDCPPVMAVTDAAIVAHETAGVVFVVGTDMTARGAAQTALKELKDSRARVVGTVLNRVDLKHNTYYYSHYYRPEYEKYYRRS